MTKFVQEFAKGQGILIEEDPPIDLTTHHFETPFQTSMPDSLTYSFNDLDNQETRSSHFDSYVNLTPDVVDYLSMGEPYIPMETNYFSIAILHLSPIYPPRMDHFHDTSIHIQPNQLEPTFESHSHSDFIKTYTETQCDVLLESSQEYVNPNLPNMNLIWDAIDSYVSFSWTQDQEPMIPINEPISNTSEHGCLNSTPWVESDCDHTYTPEVETITLEEETNDSTKSLIPEQDLVITPLLNYTPLPRYDMIFPSYLDCHIPWSAHHHDPSITI